MKSLLYSIITLISVIAFSCKEANNASNPGNDATKKVLTKEDSAYNDAIDIHDQVMPKMGKLIGYQKKLQLRLDSAASLIKQKAMPGVKAFQQRADSLLFELKLAEKGMNDWMEGFTAEPKLPTTEERTAYFEDQKAKALKMKDRFFAALEKAKEMLGE
ncbi:MAG: hypothetical protein ABIX01_11715 [Chitinophagaceae bacterium]